MLPGAAAYVVTSSHRILHIESRHHGRLQPLWAAALVQPGMVPVCTSSQICVQVPA